MDGAGALPFFFLDAHEEAATPDRLFLFGKARAAPAPPMRQRSKPPHARPDATRRRKHTLRLQQRLCGELRVGPVQLVHWGVSIALHKWQGPVCGMHADRATKSRNSVMQGCMQFPPTAR